MSSIDAESPAEVEADSPAEVEADRSHSRTAHITSEKPAELLEEDRPDSQSRMAHVTSGRMGHDVVPPELKVEASSQFEQNEAYQKQLAARLEKKKAAALQKGVSPETQ